jgi:hypothetical protein
MAKFIFILAAILPAQLFANNTCMVIGSPTADYIAKNRQKLEIKKAIGDAKVVLIGDSHDKASIRQNLEKLLPQFKAAGINSLALEFLKRNKNYDNVSGPEMLQDMEQIGSGSLKQYPLQSFVDLALTARKLGMKVIGIQHSTEELNAYASKHTFRSPFDEHDAVFAADIKQATDRGKRILVLAGLSHTAALYEKNPSDNKHIVGELIYHGMSAEKIRSFMLYTQDFYEAIGPQAEGFLPLKRGLQPGCDPLEAKSLYDGIIFTASTVLKSQPSADVTK